MMTRSTFTPPHVRRPRLALLLAAALSATLLAPAARAGTSVVSVGFEDNPYLTLASGDAFVDSGLVFTGVANVANAPDNSAVGGIFNGAEFGLCAAMMCPSAESNSSNYYAALNDSVLYVDPLRAGSTMSVLGFDASFVGAYTDANLYAPVSGLLQIQGYTADGGTAYERYALGGPVDGVFGFGSYAASTLFSSYQFTELAIFGYVCNSAGSCSAFQTNRGQFALDNLMLSVSVSAVPEPGTCGMMLLGLAGVAVAARRQQRKQVRPTTLA